MIIEMAEKVVGDMALLWIRTLVPPTLAYERP